MRYIKINLKIYNKNSKNKKKEWKDNFIKFTKDR